ncbi:hypothetical protein AMTRI_Chr03g53300 [Amborella trichopoda]
MVGSSHFLWPASDLWISSLDGGDPPVLPTDQWGKKDPPPVSGFSHLITGIIPFNYSISHSCFITAYSLCQVWYLLLIVVMGKLSTFLLEHKTYILPLIQPTILNVFTLFCFYFYFL